MNILDIFFPRRCVCCGSPGRYFCIRCARDIRAISPHEAICPVCGRAAIDGRTHPACRTRYMPDGLTVFFRYRGAVRKGVQAVKYRRVFAVSNEFVAQVAPRQLSDIQKCDMMIPVPLYPARERERGFNQADVLGKALAKRLNIPLRTDILRRIKQTAAQVSMKDRAERLKNMRGVFKATECVRDGSVILFDDVFTTGATMRAAAIALKRAGAANVWLVAMAR